MNFELTYDTDHSSLSFEFGHLIYYLIKIQLRIENYVYYSYDDDGQIYNNNMYLLLTIMIR